MGVGKSIPFSKEKEKEKEKEKKAMHARWMTIDEQENQIATQIDKEKSRVLREALKKEMESRAAAESTHMASIDLLVEKYLKNDMINSAFIPDFLERRIYANVAKLVIGLIEESLRTTNIDMLGQRISFNIQPIPRNEERQRAVEQQSMARQISVGVDSECKSVLTDTTTAVVFTDNAVYDNSELLTNGGSK